MAGETPIARTAAQYWAAMGQTINAFPPSFREAWIAAHWIEVRGKTPEELSPENQIWRNLLVAFKKGRWRSNKPFKLAVPPGISSGFMRSLYRVVSADLLIRYMQVLRAQGSISTNEELLLQAVGRIQHLDADLVLELKEKLKEAVNPIIARPDEQFPQYLNITAHGRPEDWLEDPGPLDPKGHLFYHFTCRERLDAILMPSAGLTRGDVPLSPTGGYNAPWLTSDPSWDQQQWADGSPLNKAAVRITVQVPQNHPQLHHWPVICQDTNMEPSWRAALAGEMDDTRWWIFHGRIPPSWFVKVEERPQEEPAELEWEKWGIGRSQSAILKHRA